MKKNSCKARPSWKVMKLLLAILLLLITSAGYAAHDPKNEHIQLANDKILLKFNKHNGEFISMEDLGKHEIIKNPASSGSHTPWELYIEKNGETHFVDIRNFRNFSFETPAPNTLTMIWKNLLDIQNRDLTVKVTIYLRANQSLSYWNITVEGLRGEQLSRVTFPKVAGLANSAEEYLAVPSWMGELLNDPGAHLSTLKSNRRKFEWYYPGQISMQLLTLYNKQGRGFYASCDDAKAFRKNMAVSLDSTRTLVYQMENYPSIDTPMNSYKLPYNAVIGSFDGDWITAATQYREWAVQQSWCVNSRLRNNTTAEWLTNTALWVWNRGRSEEVLKPAVDLKERLGLPVNVLWHWWHGGSYDDSFPEYIPPREGRTAFINNVKWAQENGVKSLVYMNQLQWGTSTQSWKNEKASLYAAKDKQGNINSHLYNIFTGKSLAVMCLTTPFWKNKYATLADTVINSYGVNGVYMDQACLSWMCYDRSHGHEIGGGNYWMENSGKITKQIRSKVLSNKQITLSGEGVGETWLPYIDAFLALQVSRERYAGVVGWQPIPFFQAVYHPYAIAYGNYSSLLSPPYDELWPEEHKPSSSLQLLDKAFNNQFLMEQARSFAWGMQPMIANYQPLLATERKTEIDYLLTLAKVRNNCLKYLLRGEFQRAPEMVIPEEEFSISKLSIYAGQKEKITTYHKKYPVIYHSSWKSEDNMLGIAVASIRDKTYPVNLNFKSEDYGLSDSGKIYLINAEGKKLLHTYSNGNVRVNFLLRSRGICLIEVEPG